MSYITQADLTEQLSETQLIQLTDDEKIGIINANRVSRAIANAESEINGFVGTRYAIPLASPIPALVKGWAVTVAAFFLWRRRQRAPEEIRLAYEDVIERLRDIAAGKLTLGIDPPPPESTQSSQGEIITSESIWSRVNLSDF